MSNYWSMRDAKVRISHELMNRGWKVYGYKEDRSDSMTDYFDPAHWDGIATKNGYILVIDNSTPYYANKEITKYNPENSLSHDDREKINKLEQMTVDRGCTQGEEDNAKRLIEKIMGNKSSGSAWEAVDHYPSYQGNPGKCKWHIEKDGSIYDKGTGITKYSDLPKEWEFDINKMEYKDSYKQVWTRDDENGCRVLEDRKLDEETKKIINDFKSLILRWERVANNMNTCHDGTEETKKAHVEQNKPLEKVTITKIKKEIKPVPVTDRNYIKVGDILKFSYHGHYWIVTHDNMKTGTWTQKDGSKITEQRKTFTYEILGSEKRGYQRLNNAKGFYNWENIMIKEIEEGKIKIFTLQEVETEYTEEKYISKKQMKEKKQNTNTEQSKEENNDQNVVNNEITININDEKNGIEISFSNKPSQEIIDKLKENGFRWSNYNKLWYAKNTADRLAFVQALQNSKNENNSTTNTTQEETQEEKKETIKETADNLIDYSSGLIIDLGLNHESYSNSQEYRLKLIAYMEKCNIFITEELINNIPYEALKDVLTNINNNNQNLNQYNPYATPEIKEGYLYNCHFKEWELSIEEIKSYIVELINVPFLDWGDKIGFENLTHEQTLQVKEVSDLNNSIFFIDKITPINEDITDNSDNSNDQEIQQEDPKQEEEQKQEKENNNFGLHKENDSVIINLNDYINYKINDCEDEQMKTEQEPQTQEEFSQNYNIGITENENTCNDFSFDDILSKFDTIEINNNSRITAEDQAFCENEQKLYNEAITGFLTLCENVKQQFNFDILDDKYYDQKPNNKYISPYDFREFGDAVKNIKARFISNLICYFEKKYNVSLDSNKFKNKYDFNITYNNILDEIFIQLNGMTFTEKAIQEIKDKTQKLFYYNDYRKSTNMILKNNKITIDGRYAYKDSIWNEYRLSGDFKNIFDSLQLFDNGSISGNQELNNRYCGYENEKKERNYDKYEVETMQKVKSLKFFKNGKLEIEFKTALQADQFAKEYCGYTETAKAI